MPACSVRPLRRGPTTPNTTERAPLPTNPEQCVIYIYPGPHTHTAKPGPLEPSLIPPPHLPAVIRSERTTHGHGSAHTGRRQNAAKQERAPRSHARSSRAKPKNAARKEPPTRMKQRTRTRKKPRREAVSRCVRGATVVFGRTSCRPLHNDGAIGLAPANATRTHWSSQPLLLRRVYLRLLHQPDGGTAAETRGLR